MRLSPCPELLSTAPDFLRLLPGLPLAHLPLGPGTQAGAQDSVLAKASACGVSRWRLTSDLGAFQEPDRWMCGGSQPGHRATWMRAGGLSVPE